MYYDKLYFILQVFTISLHWGNGFYHAVIEDIPRFAPYIKFLLRHPEIKVHVYSKTSTFTVSILEDLGISRRRLVMGIVGARILYQPAGSRCGGGAFFQTHVFAMISAEPLAFSHGPRDTIVLIKRSSKRWFNYHEEILKMLLDTSSKYGSKVVVYSDKAIPVLKITKNIFYSAFLIVAPHGAGLANMIYSQPGTFIIEALCQGTWKAGLANMCYSSLALDLGHRYYSVIRPDNCFNTEPKDLRPAVEFALRSYYHPDPGVTI